MHDCEILKATPENIQTCGELIRQGKLVAFPTETVYGLGANALSAEAVLKIFQTKNRPLTDPLIVHVHSLEQAFPLIDASPVEKEMFVKLAKKFWPGPLTLITKASEIIPPEITAGTGYIGVRMPCHSLALKFLESCQVPVAAPSANLFNHVSPTTAAHVFNDFFDKDIKILDQGSTTLGIESTVLKITAKEFFVLRLGSLPVQDIQNYLQADDLFEGVGVTVVKKVFHESEKVEAPGQFVKHYAPKIDALILSTTEKDCQAKITSLDLSRTVLIDFGDINERLRKLVRSYMNLSADFDVKEAMFRFYYMLREAEDVEGVDFIIIADIEQHRDKVQRGSEYLEALFDKVYRSCSGRRVYGDL